MNDLTIRNVTKSFGEKAVLRGVSMTVQAGETVSIMGPSGCGKTTLLNLIAGLIQPDGGKILGVPQRISAVFQEDRLCEAFTAVSNLRLVTGRHVPDALLRAHLERLGLADDADRPVRELSGGMKRRVAIARAVVYGGELFLLDEAFKGLDDRTKELAMDYVRSETAGKTVVSVTHDRAEAERLGGRLIQMGQCGK